MDCTKRNMLKEVHAGDAVVQVLVGQMCTTAATASTRVRTR
jgi:hypothetical protein